MGDHYQRAHRGDHEVHPVDATIERRLPHRKLRQKIRGTTEELMSALGEQRSLWLKLEELYGRYHTEREEAYFGLGYELGTAAGRAEALNATAKCGSRRQRDLAAWIRDIAIEAGLPPPLTVVTLLEVAWSLALGKQSPNEPPRRVKKE